MNHARPRPLPDSPSQAVLTVYLKIGLPSSHTINKLRARSPQGVQKRYKIQSKNILFLSPEVQNKIRFMLERIASRLARTSRLCTIYQLRPCIFNGILSDIAAALRLLYLYLLTPQQNDDCFEKLIRILTIRHTPAKYSSPCPVQLMIKDVTDEYFDALNEILYICILKEQIRYRQTQIM